MVLGSALVLLVFMAVHVTVGHLRFLGVVPRNVWLSVAGGIAVAYVFLHLLPRLGTHGQTFEQQLPGHADLAEKLVFLIALLGLVVFYGLERLAKNSRGRSRQGGQEDAVEAHLFWVHLGSFAAYNLLIGYLLVHREEPGAGGLMLFGFALATHLVTADYGLREDHKARYDHVGRWVLVAGVGAGWALGQVVRFPEVVTGGLFAFLSGGVVMNVLKEELPEDRQSRFLAFLLGAVGYALIGLAG